MISAADFPDVFPWMEQRQPHPSVRVRIDSHSDDTVGRHVELARPVDVAVTATLDPVQWSGSAGEGPHLATADNQQQPTSGA